MENQKVRRAYRQGELLFIPLNQEDMERLNPNSQGKFPSLWKKLDSSILREGEATGHKHQIIAKQAGMVSLLASAGRFISGLPGMAPIESEDRLLIVEEPIEVIHPEHRPLKLGKANFLVIVQREYDEVKARRIMD